MTQYTHVHRHHNESMLSVEEALERILGFFSALDVERKPILDALGQVLAEDAVSLYDIPPLDNSAMDGYAVQSESVAGAFEDSPAMLEVVGYVAAGQLPREEVGPGTAVRIMTGAPIPKGADAVVPFEDTDEVERRGAGGDTSRIGVNLAVPPGAEIRPAGQDVRRGTLVLKRGSPLRPAEIGVLASLGYAEVSVVRRPVVAILATGDELLEPGEASEAGKIFNSNNYSVAAGTLRYGGIPRLLGIARDNLESMNAKLEQALECDMLVTSAGVSKGDYDMVKDVLAQHGSIDFWSVRMRPAKPLAFGTLTARDGRRVPHLGLPGNPVSALVAFEQFGRPAIRQMLGLSDVGKPTVEAVLDEPIENPDGRRVYARAVVTRHNGGYRARLTGDQGSNLLTSMALANGLAICPEDVPLMAAGEVVQTQMLDWPEEVF